MSRIYVTANQKGGVGKTSTALNMGISLAKKGYKVCLIDLDGQANLTMALGCQQPDELPVTMYHIMSEMINTGLNPEKSELIRNRKYIIHSQGVDLIPSSIDLVSIENRLMKTIDRENIMKKFINYIKDDYDFIIQDTSPYLNIITVNALNAASQVLIPMQPQFFSAKGMELLLSTIGKVRQNLNPQLEIAGVLLTMYDNRIKFHREVVGALETAYGEYFRIFKTKIPMSIRVTEAQASGVSIFDYEPNGKVTQKYNAFAEEIINI